VLSVLSAHALCSLLALPRLVSSTFAGKGPRSNAGYLVQYWMDRLKVAEVAAVGPP
jgi:hypothetical protein